MRIILNKIIIEKNIENPINGICGSISLIDADIAPISALIFITFPTISKTTIGKATILEYCTFYILLMSIHFQLQYQF
jgi:hypothetical protein